MSYFFQLPEDLIRVIGYCLSREDVKQLCALEPKIVFNNPHDIFWRKKLEECYKMPNVNYQILYDRNCYQRLIKNGWKSELKEKLLNDENFLQYHIDTFSAWGETLLTFLCNENQDNEKDIMKLLSYGADVNASAPRSHIKPLQSAIITQNDIVFVELLKRGANVNYYKIQAGEFSPLMIASINDKVSKVKLLLEYGADKTAPAQSGGGTYVTALSVAKSDEVRALLQD